MVAASGPVWVIETRVGLRTTPVSSDLAWASRLVSRAAPLHGVPSWNDEVGPQRDGPRRVRRRWARRTRPGRAPSPRWPVMMVSGSKTVRAYMTPTSSKRACGRVEARLLGVHPEDERAALLGGLRARPRCGPDRSSWRRRCRPSPVPSADAPATPAAAAAPPGQQLSGDRISRPSVLHFPEPSGPPEGSRATLVPRIPCVGAVPLASVSADWDLPGFSAWLGGRAAATRKAYVERRHGLRRVDVPQRRRRARGRRPHAPAALPGLPRDAEARPRHHRPQGGGAALLLLLAGAAGSPRLRPGPLAARALGRRAPAPRALERGGRRRCSTCGAGTPVDRRDLAVLELLYAAGLRVSELCGLDRGDIDLRGRTVTVLGKGGKQRRVPIHDAAVAALRAWFEDGRDADGGPARGGLREPPGGAARAPGRAPHPGPPLRLAHPPARPAPHLRHPPPRRRAPTCGSSRSCWATPAWPPRRCTRTSARSGCARSTGRPTPGPEARA